MRREINRWLPHLSIKDLGETSPGTHDVPSSQLTITGTALGTVAKGHEITVPSPSPTNSQSSMAVAGTALPFSGAQTPTWRRERMKDGSRE